MPEPTRRETRIAMTTLVVAAVASAIATYVVSRFWGKGTIVGAAATPVIVALVSEALRKPTEQVRQTVRAVAPITALQARAPARPGAEEPAGPQEAIRQGVELDPSPVVEGPTPTAAIDDVSFPRRDHATASSANQRHWKAALLTGLIAFVIVALVYTVPDVIAGRSITGNGQSSTLFSSGPHHHRQRSTTKPDTQTTTNTKTVVTVQKTVVSTATAPTTTVPARTQSTPTTTSTQPATTQPTTTTAAPGAPTPPGGAGP